MIKQIETLMKTVQSTSALILKAYIGHCMIKHIQFIYKKTLVAWNMLIFFSLSPL